MDQDDTLKDISLINELITSHGLITVGLRELQNINGSNDFYHLPFQLLSSGLERLMKCHICLGYHEQQGIYPDSKYLKQSGGKTGHGLAELNEAILHRFFKTKSIPALEKDKLFLQRDEKLKELIFLLSEFGKYSRYHNLDLVTGAAKIPADVESLWNKFEMDIIQSNPRIKKLLVESVDSEEIHEYVNQTIIWHIECLVRALSRQFTLGELGKQARQASPIYSDFICMQDAMLGQREY